MTKHLATFNMFREPDGQLYVTIAEARGVQDELGISAGAVPLHIPVMNALFEAVRQTKERATIRAGGEGEDE